MAVQVSLDIINSEEKIFYADTFLRFHHKWDNLSISGKEHFQGMIRGLSRTMEGDVTLPPLPRFPGKPDTMMTSAALLEERRLALEEYLNTILESDVYRENPDMVKVKFVCFNFTAELVKARMFFI